MQYSKQEVNPGYSDLNKAYAWARLSAKQGNPRGQIILTELMEDEDNPDYKKIEQLLQEAATKLYIPQLID